MQNAKRALLGLTLLFSAIGAARAEEPLDTLRQRLADKLSTKDATGTAKVVGRGGDKSAAKAAPAKPAVHWGYAGEHSPEHWGGLSPDNKLCATGTRQSPIDIRDTIKVDQEKLQFDYRPGTFSVLDNGHTIQVTVAPGNFLAVMGRRYELQQFHFHRPSEERINGRQFEMVAHLVHKSADGRLAVVAVLLDRGPDNKPQPAIQSVWANLPLEKKESLTAGVPLDPAELLPEDRAYFTYMGSLTTPPCSEGVLWMVMRQPVQLTAAQIGVFTKLYPMNARPLQAGSGRLIKESQ